MLVETYGSTIGPDDLGLLRSQRKVLMLIHSANEARAIRKSRSLSYFLMYMARKPWLTANIAHRLTIKIWQRANHMVKSRR